VHWVIERTIAWHHRMRRLRIRYERRDDIHEAFLGLAIGPPRVRHSQAGPLRHLVRALNL